MKKKILIGVIVVLIALLGIYKNYFKDNDEERKPPEQTEPSEKIVIEIKGEINRPGIYIVGCNDRIYSVITLAGGLTNNAETSSLNLAQKVYDGMVINIPKLTHNNFDTEKKVSINRGLLKDLMTLKGIGEARAQAIIDYREKYGPFSSLEGLMQVNGISENIYSQIKDDICL